LASQSSCFDAPSTPTGPDARTIRAMSAEVNKMKATTGPIVAPVPKPVFSATPQPTRSDSIASAATPVRTMTPKPTMPPSKPSPQEGGLAGQYLSIYIQMIADLREVRMAHPRSRRLLILS
jgi:hypothetical protein